MNTLKIELNTLQEYDAKIERLKSEKDDKKKIWRKHDNKKINDEVNLESFDEDDLVLNDQNDYLNLESDDEEDDDDEKKIYDPVKVFIAISFPFYF